MLANKAVGSVACTNKGTGNFISSEPIRANYVGRSKSHFRRWEKGETEEERRLAIKRRAFNTHIQWRNYA